jgi:hypothetical protein
VNFAQLGRQSRMKSNGNMKSVRESVKRKKQSAENNIIIEPYET